MVEKIELKMEGEGIESARTDKKSEFRVRMEGEEGGLVPVGGIFPLFLF